MKKVPTCGTLFNMFVLMITWQQERRQQQRRGCQQQLEQQRQLQLQLAFQRPSCILLNMNPFQLGSARE